MPQGWYNQYFGSNYNWWKLKPQRLEKLTLSNSNATTNSVGEASMSQCTWEPIGPTKTTFFKEQFVCIKTF